MKAFVNAMGVHNMPKPPQRNVHTECELSLPELAPLGPQRIVVSEETFEWMVAQLDAPAKPNDRLARVLKTKAPWEE